DGAGAPSLTASERRLAAQLMPDTSSAQGVHAANTWNVAAMELGALICTARAPKCEQCPVLHQCAWVAAGKPEPETVAKTQSWNGSDRQVRGAIMGVLRAQGAIDVATLQTTVEATGRLGRHVPETSQWDRAVTGLVTDGLAVLDDEILALPYRGLSGCCASPNCFVHLAAGGFHRASAVNSSCGSWATISAFWKLSRMNPVCVICSTILINGSQKPATL